MTDETDKSTGAAEAQPVVPAERAAVVAVVGRANVGKSSLVNAILGEKISIVSPVAQTTRNVVRGILTEARGQLVFLDTPGVHKAASDLGRMMNKMARLSVEGTDAVVLLLDSAERPREEDRGWMARLAREDLPLLLVANKTDLGGPGIAAQRACWDEMLATVSPEAPPVRARPEWHSVSASTGEGVPALVARLFELAPAGPLLFPADVLSDYPRRLAIGDVIREKLYRSLREELPHAVAVWVERFDEGADGWDVGAVIYVNKATQKGIVIGEKGRALRRVKRASERELEVQHGHPVRVKLWVKVEPDWNRNFWMLKKLGYAG